MSVQRDPPSLALCQPADAHSLEVGGGMHTQPRSGSPSRLPPALSLRRPSSPAVQRLAPPPLPPSLPGSAFLGVARHVALASGLGSGDNANPSPNDKAGAAFAAKLRCWRGKLEQPWLWPPGRRRQRWRCRRGPSVGYVGQAPSQARKL